MGRRLIDKRIRFEQAGNRQRSVSDVDYLLGVSDITRQGALRFRRAGDSVYAHPSTDVPRMARLPQLLRAAGHVAHDDTDLAEIKILLDAGTGTLGGARPKASVVDDTGQLYIAKFPHQNDQWDVMAWEKTALDLAAQADISVPSTRLTTVDGQSVLLLERFDRRHGQRIGYISAMTLMQARDGETEDYADLADNLSDTSDRTDDDLAQLWQRAAFSAAIHNTDDHLRNHGLLRSRSGWYLSPIFDVNPNPDVTKGRATSIAGATDRNDEFDGLLLSADAFGLDDDDARRRLADIAVATRDWRHVAKANGIPESEINQFTDAFDGLREQFESAPSMASRRREGDRSGNGNIQTTQSGRGPARGKTTPKSNRGSFRTRTLRESDTHLRE